MVTNIGRGVEVMWGDKWIRGTIVGETETRITVRFPHPILYTERTIIIKRRWWFRDITEEKREDKVFRTMTFCFNPKRIRLVEGT